MDINKIIEIRRHLHSYPELSENEYQTQEYIINILKQNNIEYVKCANTGIVAIIRNGNGKSIAYRADMDALPIVEKTSLEYSSKNIGIMHACGHDIHMASQIGILLELNDNKDKWRGNAYFFFQPAEETVGGAKRMIESFSEIDNIDNILSFHAAPEIQAGKIGIKYGKLHSTSSVFKLVINGKSCHGALAYMGVDSILIGAKVIDYLQTIISRRIDARDCALISVCTFNAGVAENIIADRAVLTGTIRTESIEIKKYIVDILNNELKDFVKSYGATLDVYIRDSYSPVINDTEFTKYFYNIASNVIGKENIVEIEKARMDVEDFGYFLEKIKGTFYRLGVGLTSDLHTESFCADEKSIEIAIKLGYELAIDLLKK